MQWGPAPSERPVGHRPTRVPVSPSGDGGPRRGSRTHKGQSPIKR